MTCPSCGATALPDARFCASCGTALLALADERRVVTVLFADLAGFTALSERLDPEQVKNLVDRCFQRLAAEVVRFGGRVERLVGDAMLALFGAPVAHEDDAERAVRAALAMRDALPGLAQELGADLRLRIGVNTGEVLVGALGAGGDTTVLGDAVNTASRLQTAAEPGQILVGESTFAATHGAVRYEPAGVIAARGKQEPVRAWAALRATAPPGRRRTGFRAPLVGRDAERGLLEHALAVVVRRRRPTLVLLLGDAGVGKSRLAQEVAAVAQITHGAVVLGGRCVPYGEANSFWPVAEAIRQACGIGDDDSASAAFAKCSVAAAEALGAAPQSPEVARIAQGMLYVMGHERPDLPLRNVEPARAREESLRAVRQFVQGLARTRPVVLVLSDLHWADPLLLQALDRFLAGLHGVPLLVVGTARPELEATWTPRGGRYNVVTVRLDPLDHEAAAEMLRALLGAEPPPHLRDLLLDRAGGNPYFLEELVAALQEPGVLARDPAGAGLERALGPRDVPLTLRGLATARLDALAPRERELLQDAAVVGRTGKLDALAALAAARGEGEPTPVVGELVAKDFLVLEEDEYEFKSDLVREVAYDTLTKAERARRHHAVAAWLASRSREIGREDEFLEQLAHHRAVAAAFVLELGEVDGVPAGAGSLAVEALLRAARRAEARESSRLAAHLLDQALRLVPAEASGLRRQVLLQRAAARTSLRDLAGAREDLEAVREEAEEAGDALALARALTVLGEVELYEGAVDASLATLDRALRMWRDLGDPAGEADALQQVGKTQLFAGDLAAAERSTSEALATFRKLGERRGEAWGLQNLAWIAFMRGDYPTAEARLHDAGTTFAAIDDRGGVAWVQGFLAWVRFFQGRLEEAEELAASVAAEGQDVADPFARGMMGVLAGHLLTWRGRVDDGLARLRDARALFRRLGDAWGELQAVSGMVVGLAVRGDVEEAWGAAQRALDLAARVTDPRIVTLAQNTSLGLAVHLGDVARVERLLVEPQDAAEESPGRIEGQALRGLGLLQLGRVQEAVSLLEAAHAAATAPGQRAHLSGLMALAAAAAGRPEAALGFASEAEAVEGGTFRDRVLAWTARGLALTQLARPQEAEAAFQRAGGLVDATEFRLDQALVRLARARALDALGSPQAGPALREARRRLDDLHVAAVGWETAFMLAAAGPRPRPRPRP